MNKSKPPSPQPTCLESRETFYKNEIEQESRGSPGNPSGVRGRGRNYSSLRDCSYSTVRGASPAPRGGASPGLALEIPMSERHGLFGNQAAKAAGSQPRCEDANIKPASSTK